MRIRVSYGICVINIFVMSGIIQYHSRNKEEKKQNMNNFI